MEWGVSYQVLGAHNSLIVRSQGYLGEEVNSAILRILDLKMRLDRRK